MTKKLVYEALEPTLGKEIAKAAMENFDEKFFDQHKHKEVDLAKPGSMLKSAFSWHNTRRGYAFWFNQCNKL
jgi:hypothetical protein